MRNMLTGDNPARAGEDSYGKSEAIMTPPKGIGPLLKQRLWLYFCSRVMFLVTVLVMNTAKKRQKLTDEYYGAAEPPVRCGESHLSGLTEPPHFIY